MKAKSFKLTPIAMSLLLLANSSYAAETEVVEVKGSVFDMQDAHIDAEQLDKSQPEDLNDIFRKQSEVSVGGGSGTSQKIYVRGLEDTMLNISIDGAEQSSSLYHHQGSITIEPELLEKVDVQAGAGRATDGFGALGGSIKFKTKDALDLLAPGEKFGAIGKLGYYSNSNAFKGSATVYGKVSSGLGLLGSIVAYSGDNYVDGHGDEQPYTESQQASGLLKLSGNLNDKNYISVSIDSRIDAGERLHRPQWIESDINPAFDQSFERTTLTGNYAYKGSEQLNLDVSTYYTRSSLLHDEHPTWGKSDGHIDSIGLKLQNTSKFADNQVIYGVEFKTDNSDFYNSGDGGTTTEKGSAAAAFIQGDFEVSKSLKLTAGARYDFYRLTDNLDQEFEAGDLSPNLGVNYSPVKGLSLYASHAQAFRGPQVKELYVISRTNESDLSPEKAYNNEVGVNYRINAFSMGANLFASTIEDAIGYSYSSRTVDNLGDLTTDGVNAYIGYDVSFLSSRLSYSYANPELDGEALTDDSTSLGTSMGAKWVFDSVYYAADGLEFGWTGTFVERYDDVEGSGYDEKPGYGVHDIYAQWLPIDDLTLTFSVKNIFDKYYKDHASYSEYITYPAAAGTANPGRDFRLSAAYKF